jgi:hypothetical protein
VISKEKVALWRRLSKFKLKSLLKYPYKAVTAC